jgi:hypothetical protein
LAVASAVAFSFYLLGSARLVRDTGARPVARRGRTGLRLARQGRVMPRTSDDAADASRPACSSAWRISAGLFARSTW